MGFVDIGWKCVAHAGIFFVQPVGIPDDPDGDLLGFSLTLPNTYDMRRVRLMRTAKQALDYAEGKKMDIDFELETQHLFLIERTCVVCGKQKKSDCRFL